MLWQLAGPGKAVNQSMKDVLISSAKMIQQVEQQLSKNGRLAEATSESMDNMENHFAAISGHLQKLVELQSRSSRPEEPKASAKLPPPPVAPASMTVPASMTGPQATLGTAAHPVQPKLMPGSLTPPGPSGFPPSPVYPPQAFPAGLYGTPQMPSVPGGASASAAPPVYKRVKLADGSWGWAEPAQGDI